jgi:hypothetical protein
MQTVIFAGRGTLAAVTGHFLGSYRQLVIEASIRILWGLLRIFAIIKELHSFLSLVRLVLPAHLDLTTQLFLVGNLLKNTRLVDQGKGRFRQCVELIGRAVTVFQ